MAPRRDSARHPSPADEAPRTSLGARASWAALWSFANTLFVRLIGVVSGVVLARLIVPEQFGVFAAAIVVFSVLISVSEMGVSVALVRRTGDVSGIAPTVVTLSITSSTVLTLLCVALAPAFSEWMHAPDAAPVLQLMALGLPLAGVSAVPSALCQRGFRQDKRALAEGVAAVAAAGVGILLAALGMGAWSLAWSRVAALLITALVLHVVVRERYRPGYDREQARALLAFGLPLAGSSLLVLAVLNVDYVVVGRLLGTEQLGFYALAFNLASWPVAALSAPARNVSVAWLSHLRDAGSDPNHGFGRLLGPLMLVTVPTCTLLAVVAEPLVSLVYGRVWLPAAVPLAALAILGALRVALEVFYDTLVCSGDTRAILGIHVAWFGALVPALALGATRGGLLGVAAAHVVVVLVVAGPLYLRALRRLGLAPASVGRILARPALGGLAIVVVACLARRLGAGDIAQLGAGFAAAAVVYPAIAVPHPVRRLQWVIRGEWRRGALRGPGTAQ